ncbi:hypothetical protein BV25DRAFT_1914282 [Artomyces pyxidatus]|uniref:Uncharacterized protein n=1 Tax=Artomyces pyxidatus TaxID=48021 RepID=A0ACB8T7Q9_9AGAM|nr:hypothetical protein BV25DRAFT_1914282 [Artomyces pyxidatus]
MSYRPPYAAPANPPYPSQPAYHTQYQDGTEYSDPYGAHQPHETYDQSGYDAYRDEPQFPPQQNFGGEQQFAVNRPKEEPTYEIENYTVTPRPAKTSRDMRAWRYDHQGHLWTAGSRTRCCGRFFCCTILITLFLFISIVLSLALWIQPPNIIIGDVQETTNGSTIQLTSDGLQVNLALPIEVDNPNYFSAKLTNVHADIIYPINSTLIGSGDVKNVQLPSHSNTNFTFPFMINYTQSIDPTQAIISDLASKCLASPQQDLTVSYKLTVGVRVFLITVSPTINNSLKFACPVSASDIEGLLKNLGVGGLAGILGLGSK